MSKTIKYVECANCGEVVGTYYVTCPYCGYRLSARKPTTGMDPLYGMTDSEFYKRFGSIGHHSPAATRKTATPDQRACQMAKQLNKEKS